MANKMKSDRGGVARRGVVSVAAMSAAVALGFALHAVPVSNAQRADDDSQRGNPMRPPQNMALVAQEPAPVGNARIADRVVNVTARVQAGELVRINGNPKDLALIEAIAVAVAKRGAHPIVTMWTDAAERAVHEQRPEQFDATVGKGELALAKIINVVITLPGATDPAAIESLTPARRQKQQLASQAIARTLRARKVRVVELNNQLYPSTTAARQLGVSLGDLTKVFTDGLAADHTAIEARAVALQKALAKGGELRVTHPNGTDLKLKLRGKLLVSDGVISAADVKAGGALLTAYLPAGEVYFVPVPGSAEGKLVDDRTWFDNKELTGLTLEVKAGKIATVTAKSGWDGVKAMWESGGAGKLELSAMDIGINPSVKNVPTMETWIAAGAVTFTTGNNEWAGGKNKEPVSLTLRLQGATVTFNGAPLVDAGVLK